MLFEVPDTRAGTVPAVVDPAAPFHVSPAWAVAALSNVKVPQVSDNPLFVTDGSAAVFASTEYGVAE
jgi:hypothetical protein